VWLAGSRTSAQEIPVVGAPEQRDQAHDERERARALYEQASRAYEQDDYAAALALLRSAQEAFPSSLFVFNIAQALRQLGRCSEARDQYEQFLAAERDVELRARAQVGLEKLKDCHQSGPMTPAQPTHAAYPANAASRPAAPPQQTLRLWVGWGSSAAVALSTAVTGGLWIGARARLREEEARRPAREAEVHAAERRAQRLAIATDVLGLATLALVSVSIYWTVKEVRARVEARGSAREQNKAGPGARARTPRWVLSSSGQDVRCALSF
jgi:tetratricopeptide (TPR) repeat protein